MFNMTNIIPLLTNVIIGVLIYMTFFYILSIITKRSDVVDIGWGLGFVLISLISLLNQEVLTDRMLIVFILVLFWGLRLSSHIFLRNIKKEEDYRYKKFKKDWGDLFYIRSYFQIFLLQGLLMILVSSPIILISSSQFVTLGIFDYIGISLWIIGFLIETISDLQLKHFITLKKEGKTKTRFANIGLWKSSRHPNYFGEILQWWGIGTIALSVPFGYVGLIGPILITYLLVFVSGIPLLEKKFEKDPEWSKYVNKTRKLIPFPKNF
jgi:steroid 5-alpha reductase family enzyme